MKTCTHKHGTASKCNHSPGCPCKQPKDDIAARLWKVASNLGARIAIRGQREVYIP